MKKLVMLGGLVASAASILSLSAPAYADPPVDRSLPAPSFIQLSVSQIPGWYEDKGGYLYEVDGCRGSGGAPGVVTATLSLPNGEQHTASVSADSTGHAVVGMMLGYTIPGTATVHGTCDIYGESVAYPVASVDVPEPPASMPPISVALSSDGSDIVLSGSGCIADGTRGSVFVTGYAPGLDTTGSTKGTFFPIDAVVDNSGEWTLSLAAVAGDYVIYAGCDTAGWGQEYDAVSFSVVESDSGARITGSTSSSVSSAAPAIELAATGVSVTSLGWAAALLVTGGTAAAYVGRRRKL